MSGTRVETDSFGAIDVPRRKYEILLAEALESTAKFYP